MNAQGQKTGGRQKGTPNKITAEVREFLASLVFDNVDLIQQDLRNMTTEQRMNFLPKILPYIAPKVKPVSEEQKQERIAQQLHDYSALAQCICLWEQQQNQSLKEKETASAQTAVQNTNQTEQTTMTDDVQNRHVPNNDNSTTTTTEIRDVNITNKTKPLSSEHENQTDEVPENLHEKQPEDKDEIMAFIRNHLEQKINGKQREAKACLQLTPQTTTNATATSPKQKNKATTQHTPFYRNIPTKRKHKK